MKSFIRIVCAGAFFFGSSLFAQNSRYELGQHLRAFEQEFAKHKDNKESRKRVVPLLWKATPYFFTARWGDAARVLDDAKFALTSEKKRPQHLLWAESLRIQPTRRIYATNTTSLSIKLSQFYKIDKSAPNQYQIRMTLFSPSGKPQTKLRILNSPPLDQVYTRKIHDISQGDYELRIEMLVKGTPLTKESIGISFVTNLEDRLKKLDEHIRQLPDQPNSLESGTLRELTRILHRLNGSGLETDYPGARLLEEAEGIIKAIRTKKTYYGPGMSGQHWIRLPTQRGNIVARIFVPKNLDKSKPVPTVVALHGAGTTENMFFDAYGLGKIVDLCRQRGWLLIAPRSPPFSFRSPTPAIIDAFAERYPVDKSQVFVVGHSMGAAQAVTAAQEAPDRFAAIAALAGSSRVNSKVDANLQEVPFFVGVGNRDFALEGSQRLAKNLKEKKIRTVQYREYPDIEHVTIVQTALPDVFAFFDKQVK